MLLGKYLRSKRLAAGLSLRDVADALGVSHVFLGEVERGVRSMVKRERLLQLEEFVPGFSLKEAETLLVKERPLQLSLEDASPQYQSLGLALARRINQRDIRPKEFDDIMRILRGSQEDE